MIESRQMAPVLEKAYQFMLWLIPTVEKFPKSQKFLLGDRMQTTALDMLEGLIDATYSRNRKSVLSNVNLKLERLRFLFRLSKDLKYIDTRRYEHAARDLDDIGRQVGGWIRKSHAQEA